MRGQKPDGINSVIEAVHTLDLAKEKVTQLEGALSAAREDVEKADLRLRELVAHGVCQDDCPPPKAVNGAKEAATTDATTVVIPSKKAPQKQSVIVPEDTAICWKIAFRLLENPELDYQGTAEAIWGPGLDKKVAKNRVNAQVTRLKKLGVASALGGNRLEIDAAKLAELSKIPIPEGSTVMH